MAEGLADLRRRLADNLAGFPVQRIKDPALRHAAVVIAVTTGPDGRAVILLTRRPATMGRHAGQYALPGGRLDPGETPAQAALRELDEELGLAAGADAILGQLDDYATRSGFCVSPFVVWAGPDAAIRPDPGEVSQVIPIPFDELDSPAIPHLAEGHDGGPPVLYSRFPSVGNQVFAPTAAIIYQFREVAIRGLATRVAHFDQPRFAWQ